MQRGVFDLRAPSDLLQKLRFDVDRLKRNHADSYAAFDVAVCGYHIAEWLEHDGITDAVDHALKEPSVELARAIANGAKHFIREQEDHGVVTSTSSRMELGLGGLDCTPIGWLPIGDCEQIRWLEIEVAPKIGNATGLRRWKAHDWAEKLLAYWEADFEARSTGGE